MDKKRHILDATERLYCRHGNLAEAGITGHGNLAEAEITSQTDRSNEYPGTPFHLVSTSHRPDSIKNYWTTAAIGLTV